MLGIGSVLRIVRYADNRSFWLDEALLGLNLIDRSVSQLADSLDYVQSAPYGFLLAEKASLGILGQTELTLRLAPLLASLLALGVFGLVATRLLAPPAAALAAGLFALGEPLIYQASEAKPYSSDVLACLVVVWLTLRTWEQDSRAGYVRWIAAFGVGGAAAVWFSYPAAFVLAGAGCSLAVRALLRRAPWQLPALAVLAGAWLGAFALSYATSAGTITTVRASVFTDSPSAASRLGETIHLAWFSFSDPGGFYPPLRLVAVLCLALGLVAVAREGLDRLVLLAGPGALAIAAALLSKYPLGGRFVLFLAPLGFIVIACGAQLLWELTGRTTVVAAAAALALVGTQVYWSVKHVADPPRREDVRPLLQSLKRDWRTGDTLYVYRNAQYALRWYAACEDCDVRPLPFSVRPAGPGADDGLGNEAALVSSPPSVLVGRGPTNDATVDHTVDSLAGKPRVWFLFTHAGQHDPEAPSDEQRFLEAIDRSGARVESQRKSGASLYLVDFSTRS